MNAGAHDEGFPWSSFLWDLRKRAVLLRASFTNTTIDEHAVEGLEFEALTRTPQRLDDLDPIGEFQPGAADALQRLLDADARLTGKQLSYEILSSAARHGIKLDPYVAAVEPDRFNYQQAGPPISFRVFTGANPDYVIRFSTDPIGVTAPSKTTATVITISGSTHPIPADIGHGNANLTDTVTLTSADLDPLLAGATGPVPLYYLLESLTRQTTPPDPSLCPDITNCNLRQNLIPGAGFTFADPDLPVIMLLPPGAGPGCRCDIRSENTAVGGTAATIFVPSALVWLRIRRRRRSQ